MFGEEEGLLEAESVKREAEVAEGVVALMGLRTDRLIEEFSAAACESAGIGVFGEREAGPKLPMWPDNWEVEPGGSEHDAESAVPP